MNSDRVIIATEYINTCFAKLTKKEKKKRSFQTFFLGVDDLEIWINHSQIINWYFGSHSHEVISSQISFSIQNIIKRKYYSIQIGSLQDNSIFIKQKYYDIYWIQGFAQFSLKDSPMVQC